MPINTETLNRQLYKRLSKYKPKPLDAKGNVTPVEDEADVFKFTFSKDGKDYGNVFATIDDNHALTIYYSDDVTESPPGPGADLDYDDSWTGLLKQLKSWAMHNQLSWNLKDRSRLEGDMARRDHMNRKDKISEGYHAMGKSRSYSDNIPSVKIVIEHSRQIEEGEQRYRNINKIFLENQMGERFLLDTKKPGIARVYARHIAEGGKVNDERWGHIQGLCEEYQKMAGFVRATRNGQFNESAQKLVNEAINHYQGLRESLSRMTGKRGYEAYFESWTPPLMEDETDTSNLNELFVQETLDPRIESVMPILSKLQKNLGEMKEVSALAEWADSLLEGGDGGEASEEPVDDDMGNDTFGDEDGNDAPADDLTEAPGSETLAHNDRTEAGNLKAFDLDEEESLTSNNPIGIPEEEVDESALQAYLGDKKYGKDGMDALRKAGREHAGKEKMQNIRAKFSNKEKDVEEGFVGNMINKAKGMFTKPGQPAAAPVVSNAATQARIAAAPQGYDPNTGKPQVAAKAAPGAMQKGGTMDMTKKVVTPVAKPAAAPAPGGVQGIKSNVNVNTLQKFNGIVDVTPKIKPQIKDAKGRTWTKTTAGWTMDGSDRTIDRQDSTYQSFDDAWRVANGAKPGNVGVAEDLDANQKRVGQLGPTEKVGPKGAVGKLVGANENFINTDAQAVVTEVDTGEYDARKSSSKGETTPEQEKDFRKKVQAYGKELEQRQKEKVKEGQDDLNAIKRLLGK